MKLSDAANDKLIDRTITLCRTRLRRDLSRADARQIAENIVGFFSILAEWSRAEVQFSANGNGCFQNKEASRER